MDNHFYGYSRIISKFKQLKIRLKEWNSSTFVLVDKKLTDTIEELFNLEKIEEIKP